MSVVRSSKFRHIFGQQFKNDLCFKGVKVEGSGDTNCAVSCRFFAAVKLSKIFVIRLDQHGRHEENDTPFIDCKSKVLDIAWSPFNDQLLASGEESGMINVWYIPEDGLTEPMNEPFWQLDRHRRKITNLIWHPTAEYILAATGHDQFISVWNCEQPDDTIAEIPVGEMPTNAAFNTDGSLMAITTKENKVMSLTVVEPRTGEVVAKNPEIYQGLKPTKCFFLKNGNIVTIGSDKQANRTIIMWKAGDLSELTSVDLGNSSAVLNAYYDSDLQLLYTHGKGEPVRYFEVDEEGQEIYFIGHYTSAESSKGGNFMPKRAVNTAITEIARFYKFGKTKCEPVSFIVPRKSEHFQSDIYPSCASDEAALTAAEWAEGKNAPPRTKDFEPSASAGAATKEPKKISKALPKKAPPPSSRSEAKSASASASANGIPEGIDFAELVEDMKKVKATVRKLNKRVAKLEEMLEQQDAGEEEE